MADNESKLSLENARRVASLLRPLSPQAKNDLLVAKRQNDFASFQKVAFENRLDASSVWTGIDDLWQQSAQGIDIPLDDSGQNESQRTGEGRAGIAGAIAGGILLRREGSYENFQKDANEYAEFARKTWEKEEEKILKDPKYKVPAGRAIDAQEAYDRAHRQYHEMLASTDQVKAKKWLEKNPSNTSLALAINKASVVSKKLTYEELKKIQANHSATIQAEWNGRDPSKRSRDRAHMLTQANEELYDHFAFSSPETVRKWANEYNDPELYAALERKRQRDEAQAVADQGRVSKWLGRNPAAKFAPGPEAIPVQTTPIVTPLPVLNPAFKIDPEKLAANQHAKNEPDESEKKNEDDGNSQTGSPTKKRGVRSRLSYYSPSQIRKRAITRVKNRIINSKLGQKFKNSRIGKLGSRLNHLKGKTSRATRRIKNLLNPLNYLLNLLKRSIIGSLVNAAAAAVTTILSTVVSVTVGTVTAVVGVFSAAVGAVMGSIGLPLVIIIVLVALLFIVFAFSTSCIVFCDQETRQFVDSPYPGISYSIVAPETLPNGTNLNYSIVVMVDTAIAQDSPNDLSAVANIPPGTTFVSATGTYSLSDPGKISWKLYPENSSTANEGKIILTFAFNLTVRPQNDIVVENLLTIEGASGGAPPASGLAPNDNYCNGKYTYVLSNKLLAKNFGDPDCTLDTMQKRNDLYDLLKQKDPQWADFWFNVIIPGESGYRPNAWGCGTWNASEKQCNPPFAPRGAWGLFQMGSSRPPGELKARGGTRGDVTWKEQVNNAINHNKFIDSIGLRFRYWQVAIEWCRDGNMSKPQCRDM